MLTALLELVAVTLIVVGVGMVSVPASFVVAGVLGLVASWRITTTSAPVVVRSESAEL